MTETIEQASSPSAPPDPTEAVEDLLRSLRTHREGLSSREAQRRLTQYGSNELERRRGAQWPRELARQFTHPLALLLWAAALLSFIVGSDTIGVAVMLIIVLNAVVALIQERHAEKAVEALAGYIPQKITVMRDRTPKVVDAVELVPGDIALIEEGERIAADMRLISGAVEVDLSTITGESVPAMRSAEYRGPALIAASKLAKASVAHPGSEGSAGRRRRTPGRPFRKPSARPRGTRAGRKTGRLRRSRRARSRRRPRRSPASGRRAAQRPTGPLWPARAARPSARQGRARAATARAGRRPAAAPRRFAFRAPIAACRRRTGPPAQR